MAEKRVSASKFVQGGLLNDLDVTFKRCRFVRFDYDGKADEVTALEIQMQPLNSDEEPTSQHWSIGGGDDFMPSKDGTYLVQNGDRTSLAKGSNYQIFLQSLENAYGQPFADDPNDPGEDMSRLDGTVAHVLRVPAPKRSGLKQNERQKREGGEQREQEILTAAEVHSWPWEKGKKGAKAKPKASAPSAKAEEADEKPAKSKKEKDAGNEEANTEAASLVKKVLLGGDGEMSLEDLRMGVFRAAPKGDKEARQAMMELVNDDDWLTENCGVTIDGKMVSV